MVVESRPASPNASTIGNNISGSFGHPREVVCGRHTHEYHDAFETRLSSPAAKYPVRNGNDVCPKAMSAPPYRSLAPIHHGWGSDVQCIWESENRAKAWRQVEALAQCAMAATLL